MPKNKILNKSDIYVLFAVLFVYGCSGYKKENAVNWSNLNYAKISCEKDNEDKCKSALEGEGIHGHAHGHGKR